LHSILFLPIVFVDLSVVSAPYVGHIFLTTRIWPHNALVARIGAICRVERFEQITDSITGTDDQEELERFWRDMFMDPMLVHLRLCEY